MQFFQHLSAPSLTVVTALLYASWATGAPPDPYAGCPTSDLERDVIVVGGGSGGTHAAIQIQRQGKSVAVLERESDLGGNVQTFYNPGKNQTMDYGVVLYSNTSYAREYLDYLNVDMIAFEGFDPEGKTLYIDKTSGKQLKSPVKGNATKAGEIFYDQLKSYGSLFKDAGFFLPDPVPKDLLLPWGQWLKKYKASATAYNVFYEQAGDALELPTLYIMKYWNDDHFSTNSLTTAGTGNQEIYNSAYAKLGPKNVLLQSNIRSIKRSKNGIVAKVDTPCGLRTVRSKQLVIAIRPKYSDLKPFLDVRPEEKELFEQFTNIHTWTTILENSGIPANTAVQLVDTSRQGGVPLLPETLGISSSAIPGLDRHAFWWSSKTGGPDEEAEQLLIETAEFVQKSLGYTSPHKGGPKLVGTKHHHPYLVRVPSEAIANGFYDRLNGLQGKHNTFWAGSAWESESSASIWKFNDQVMVPSLMKA